MNTSINRHLSEAERIANLCRHATILGRVGMSAWYANLQMRDNETDAVKHAVAFAYQAGRTMREKTERRRGIWAHIRRWFSLQA